ncbi:MAG: hypothetical protein KGP35_10655, partial [Bacteroidetes bacterium]|nr:hypothetical protein [Bacteroidota bacterium]
MPQVATFKHLGHPNRSEKNYKSMKVKHLYKAPKCFAEVRSRIAKLELQLEKSNQSLVELDYSNQIESEKQFAIRREVESELSQAMTEWENLQSELDG